MVAAYIERNHRSDAGHGERTPLLKRAKHEKARPAFADRAL